MRTEDDIDVGCGEVGEACGLVDVDFVPNKDSMRVKLV